MIRSRMATLTNERKKYLSKGPRQLSNFDIKIQEKESSFFNSLINLKDLLFYASKGYRKFSRQEYQDFL